MFSRDIINYLYGNRIFFIHSVITINIDTFFVGKNSKVEENSEKIKKDGKLYTQKNIYFAYYIFGSEKYC